MNRTLPLTFFWLLYFLTSAGAPQSGNDSLQIHLKNAQEKIRSASSDSSRIRQYQDFCSRYRHSHPLLVKEMALEGAALSLKKKDQKAYQFFIGARLQAHNKSGEMLDVIRFRDSLIGIQDVFFKPDLKSYLEFALAYIKTGRNDQALRVNKEALELARKEGNQEVEIQILNNIALIHEAVGQPELSDRMLREALHLARSKKIVTEEIRCLVNISALEGKRKNFTTAVDMIQQAIPLIRKYSHENLLSLAFANLSYCQWALNNYEQALVHVRQSIDIRSRLADSATLPRSYYILSKILLSLGKTDSAQHYAAASLRLARKAGLTGDVRDTYDQLALIDEQRGDFRSAYFQVRQMLYWKDSALKQERELSLKGELLSLQYDETALFRKRFDEAAASIWIYRALSILFFVLFAWSFWWGWRIRRKWQAEVARQSAFVPMEEAEAASLDLLKARIDDLSIRLSVQQRQDLEELRRLLREAAVRDDRYWNEFLLLFSNIYPQFNEKLMSSHRNLTTNEIRLAALIKLNVSIQDTANALNVTVDSVRKARYRMYKKLGLNSDQELAELLVKL